MKPEIKRKVSGRGELRGSVVSTYAVIPDVNICSLSILSCFSLVIMQKNGLIYGNLIPRIPGNLDNKSNKMQF